MLRLLDSVIGGYWRRKLTYFTFYRGDFVSQSVIVFSITCHIDKAIGYSDKAHYELQTALNIALEGKGLSDEEKELLSVDFATGPEEAVERVADGSCNDEPTSAWDSPIRDCRISEVYHMTGEQIREYFNL